MTSAEAKRDTDVERIRDWRGFDRLDFYCCSSILLLPFALLAIGDEWLFPQPYTIDSWVYSGLHLHLREFLQVFANTYYASRIPWTVLGWLLHSIFDDVTALYILHFSVFYLGVFSLYIAVRTIFANRMAGCAAAL